MCINSWRSLVNILLADGLDWRAQYSFSHTSDTLAGRLESRAQLEWFSGASSVVSLAPWSWGSLTAYVVAEDFQRQCSRKLGGNGKMLASAVSSSLFYCSLLVKLVNVVKLG